jgi:hypothetical protein
MSDYTEAEALLAEITPLIPVEKTLDARNSRLYPKIGDQIRRLKVKLWEAGCLWSHNQIAKSKPD